MRGKTVTLATRGAADCRLKKGHNVSDDKSGADASRVQTDTTPTRTPQCCHRVRAVRGWGVRVDCDVGWVSNDLRVVTNAPPSAS